MNKRSEKLKKKLIESCLQNLRKFDCYKVELTPPGSIKKSHDGLLRLFRTGEQFNYVVDVKHRPTMSKAEILLYTLNAVGSEGHPVMLFADYIHEQMGEYFRKNQIEFIDLAGNVYINRPSLNVFILGRKAVQTPEKTTRAFQATGLKVIFLFLKKLESLNWNYREIERTTGISLGGIACVIRDLREMGFVRLKGGDVRQSQRELIKGRELLDRWDLGYAERLRPSLFYNRYRMADSRSLYDLLNDILGANADDRILIGGELGAALLVKDLHPQSATLIYAADHYNLIMLLKLIPDPTGNIDVLDSFGTFNHFDKELLDGFPLADPLLIRSELLLRGSDQLRAIADKIYNSFIKDGLEIHDQDC